MEHFAIISRYSEILVNYLFSSSYIYIFALISCLNFSDENEILTS